MSLGLHPAPRLPGNLASAELPVFLAFLLNFCYRINSLRESVCLRILGGFGALFPAARRRSTVLRRRVFFF